MNNNNNSNYNNNNNNNKNVFETYTGKFVKSLCMNHNDIFASKDMFIQGDTVYYENKTKRNTQYLDI